MAPVSIEEYLIPKGVSMRIGGRTLIGWYEIKIFGEMQG